MPSWNIHLEAGEHLAKKLKFSPQERKEFLLGCLLPDINNSYINQAKIVKPHRETHYAFDKKSSLNFYAENRAKIEAKNPIFLGYLFHLFTDGYFNYDFYRNVKHHQKYQTLSHIDKRKIKHHDFWLYDTKYHHFIGIENQAEAEKLAQIANQVKAADITASDLLEIEDILKSDALGLSVQDQNYLYYTEPALDQLLDDMIQDFQKQYFGGKYA